MSSSRPSVGPSTSERSVVLSPGDCTSVSIASGSPSVKNRPPGSAASWAGAPKHHKAGIRTTSNRGRVGVDHRAFVDHDQFCLRRRRVSPQNSKTRCSTPGFEGAVDQEWDGGKRLSQPLFAQSPAAVAVKAENFTAPSTPSADCGPAWSCRSGIPNNRNTGGLPFLPGGAFSSRQRPSGGILMRRYKVGHGVRWGKGRALKRSLTVPQN